MAGHLYPLTPLTSRNLLLYIVFIHTVGEKATRVECTSGLGGRTKTDNGEKMSTGNIMITGFLGGSKGGNHPPPPENGLTPLR
jgi:hypothetical protein